MTTLVSDAKPSPKNEQVRLLAELIKVLRLLPLMPIAILWNSFVLFWLWRWFVVTLGVTGISYWHAIGLELLLGFCRNGIARRDGDKATSANELKKQFVVENGIAALILVLGWLVHLAMVHF